MPCTCQQPFLPLQAHPKNQLSSTQLIIRCSLSSGVRPSMNHCSFLIFQSGPFYISVFLECRCILHLVERRNVGNGIPRSRSYHRGPFKGPWEDQEGSTESHQRGQLCALHLSAHGLRLLIITLTSLYCNGLLSCLSPLLACEFLEGRGACLAALCILNTEHLEQCTCCGFYWNMNK